jgi:hypothetical protein
MKRPQLTDQRTRSAVGIYKDGTYLKNNKTWHIEDSPWKAMQIAVLWNRNNIIPKCVCEVGCGAGDILSRLSESYTDTTFVGYELSPQAFELCKERASDKVAFHLKSILEEDVFYDCLLCIDVFEHVEDYMGFLRELRSKADVKVFHIPLDISVSAVMRSTMTKLRQSVGHLHYFTRDTALATLTDCGYEIIDSFYTTSFIDLADRSKTWRAKFGLLRYKMLYAMCPDLAVKLYGGCSLIVLAR